MASPAGKPLRVALALLGLAVVTALAPAALADQSSSAQPPDPAAPTTATVTAPTTTSTGPTTTGPTTTAPTDVTTTAYPPSTTYPPTTTSHPSAPPPRPGENFALSGKATASSTFTGYSAAKVNDGDTSTLLGGEHSWANDIDRSPTTNPEWVFVRWPHQRPVSRVVVHTTDGYELRDFDVQVLHEDEGWWDTVRTYNYNTSDELTVRFPPRRTKGVKILAKVGPSHQPTYTRVNEIQVFAR
ncbi:galactose-binding domain-containing protein [Saccharothrix algeriensis]|uniref:F5/8 type C domain-containing protein n=2 Tax=Saccharothrix algeriensis TaxID=173560 RepID=A0ABS2SH97_9PSEU|nr:hypothetical protein [Saccharothrix algeriensis]MBM7815170.1 hypothetical protein [Saccharothrix algeriensis]